MSDWSPMYSDALIRLSDYEALQAECEKLRKFAEKQPAPDVSALVEALEGLMLLESRGRIMPVGPEWDAARSALADYRQGGGA